jgi:diguanylate cyclase (GGDEF)-like protein
MCPLHRLRFSDITRIGDSVIPAQETPEPDGNQVDPPDPSADLSFLENLPVALVAKHDELDRLLHEVNEISNSLQPNASPDIQNLSQALLRAVRYAVRQSLLDKELCSLALTDELTNLNNRRGFLVLAGQQLKLCRRDSKELLLFSADVDKLKQINDSFGHHEGDAALIRVANALRQTFRDSDILARFGGDEFFIMALKVSTQYEEAILQRLKLNLGKVNAGESRFELSVSVGVAEYDPHGSMSLQELMAQADRSMYRKKRASRKTRG